LVGEADINGHLLHVKAFRGHAVALCVVLGQATGEQQALS
jgi:hypothetical protein